MSDQTTLTDFASTAAEESTAERLDRLEREVGALRTLTERLTDNVESAVTTLEHIDDVEPDDPATYRPADTDTDPRGIYQ